MKNNRLTNDDLTKLRMACDRIRDLASLEKAHFHMDEEKDRQIKKEIRPYMMWFECIANSVDDLLDGKYTEFYQFR